jgi:phage baseplate assembly protein W
MATSSTINANPGETIVYSDVNQALGTSSPYELLYNEDAIKQSILTILGTRRKSRVCRRAFGYSIEELLFEPLDNVTAILLRTRIQDAIGKEETRVVLDSVEVLADYDNDQYYTAIIGHIPRLANKSFNLNFNLKRSST